MINGEIMRRENSARYLRGFTPNRPLHSFVFSGNVTGAMLASFCLEGTVPVLHGSVGCALHYRNIFRRGSFILDELICTDLEEADLVLGGGEKLSRAVLKAYEKYAPERILIIPTDPVLMVADDIQSVLDRLAGELNCDLICANIKAISQPFARWRRIKTLKLSDAEAKIETDGIKPDLEMENHGLGCGYADVFRQLIDKYMLPLPRDDKLLVIGGMPVAQGERTLVGSAIEELEEFGLRSLCVNKPVDVETFAKVPAAAFSVGFPCGCAYTLKRKFGINTMPETIWRTIWDGLDGLEEYYLNLARQFNLGSAAERKIASRKQEVRQRLDEASATLRGESCALCVTHPSVITWAVRLMHHVLNVHVRYILLNTHDMIAHNLTLTPQDIETMIRRNMANATEVLGYTPTLLVNPTAEQITRVAGEADYFIGADNFPAIHENGRGITFLPERPSGFSVYEPYLATYVKTVRENNHSPHRQPLLRDVLTSWESKNTRASYQLKARLEFD